MVYRKDIYNKQNRDSIEGHARRKVKLGKTGLNNWSISKSQNGRNQVPGRINVHCSHATIAANSQ